MSFHVGETVGNYRIVGILGAGGAGRVFRVEHAITGRAEAMKVLLESDTQGPTEQAERFLREIKVQARLNHPNIASVHNAFWAGERLVMVMEFVEGESLEDRLAQGRVPLPAGVAYMRQALAALAYAHARGITHRDVKPANLMIASQGGAIKVMDFGLARSGADPRLTQTGTVIGSLYYISPEQVKASPHLDERTDIYSLGAVFYEVATGRKPFPCDQAFELMSAHVSQLPEPPVAIEPSLPQSLSNAILRAMAKDPADRFASANEFLEALAGSAATGIGETDRVSSFELASATSQLETSAPEEPTAAPIDAASEGAGWRKRRGNRHQKPPSPKHRRKRFRQMIYASALTLAAVFGATWLSTTATEDAPVLEAESPVSSGGFELLRRLRLRAEPTATSFSADGRWVAAGTSDHQVRVWSARTGQEEMSLNGHSAKITALAFSPEGRSLASASTDHEVKLWDLGAKKEHAALSHPSAVLSVAFTPDGSHLATGTSDERVYLWKVAGVEAMRRFYTQGPPTLLAFSPSGEQLAVSAGRTGLELWDLNSDTERGRSLETESDIVAFQFRSDGRSLATLSRDSLEEWNLSSLRLLPSTSTVRAIAFAFTAKGHCLALTRDRENVTVRDVTAAEQIGFLQHSDPVRSADLSFDGLRAVTYAGAGNLWLWQASPALMAAQGAVHRAPPGSSVDSGRAIAQQTFRTPRDPRIERPKKPGAVSGSGENRPAEIGSSDNTTEPNREDSNNGSKDENDKESKPKRLFKRVIGVFR